MIRYGALALGLSYACLWFVNLGGDAFRIAALALMVAGLVLVLAECIAPTPCPCELDARVDADIEQARAELAVDDIAVGPLTAGTIDAELVITPAAAHRPYLDPNTTGPIPIVHPATAWFEPRVASD